LSLDKSVTTQCGFLSASVARTPLDSPVGTGGHMGFGDARVGTRDARQLSPSSMAALCS